jgi:tetratricopeptide (TPR) repeat protein
MTVVRCVLLAACGASLVRPSAAQDVSRLLSQAESLAAHGNPARAHALAVEAANANPNNAHAWVLRGLTASAQRPFPLGRFGVVTAEYSNWQREAAEALARATEIAPDSARFWVELGIVQSLSTDATVRRSALDALQRGRELALAAQDGPVTSRAHEAIGWWYWRRFERALADLPSSPETHNELRNAMPGDSAQRDTLENFLEWGHGWQSDYLEATEHFERAVFADSANARARHDVLRSLVTFERWRALRAVALQQVRDVRWDPWSWLALGLAHHREGSRAAAAAAFDTALTLLTASEREHLLDLGRILPPDGAAQYANHLPGMRPAVERFYWLHSDPLWLEPGNGRWLEFLSRVTFAELRWGAPELGIRGLNSDPARLFVRYGPPSRIAGADSNRLGVAHVTWVYSASARFRFIAQPLLGAQQLDPESAAQLQEMIAASPVSWPAAADDGFEVRDIAVQSAAFLPANAATPPDSLSVVVLAPVQADFMRTPEVGLFLADRAGRAERMPTTPSTIVPLEADGAWRAYEAHAPGVSAYVRFEMRDSARQRARRAAAELTPLGDDMPLVSDLLVARCLLNGEQHPARWFDARVALSVSEGCPAGHLAILWEEGTTESAVDGGSVRLSIRAGLEDDLQTLLSMAADPRAATMEARALGVSERAVRPEALAQRGNREIALQWPIAPVPQRATLRFVELSFRAVKRSNFVVTLTRTFPDGRVVTRERRIPWWG